MIRTEICLAQVLYDHYRAKWNEMHKPCEPFSLIAELSIVQQSLLICYCGEFGLQASQEKNNQRSSRKCPNDKSDQLFQIKSSTTAPLALYVDL